MTDDLSYWFRYGVYYGVRKMPRRVYAGVRDEPITPSWRGICYLRDDGVGAHRFRRRRYYYHRLHWKDTRVG